MNTVHWHITFQMEFRHSYASIVQKQANLIVLSAQAEARTWLKWNICRSSSSYRNMQSDNKMTFFKWETVSDIWATVIQCPTSRVSVLSAESLSTILTGTSRANFWYTWMRSYNPKISSLDETIQTNQNNDHLIHSCSSHVKYDRRPYLLRYSSESQSFIRYCPLTEEEWSRVTRTASISSWAVLFTEKIMWK